MIRFGTKDGQDPFGKVRGLIIDLIKRLQQDLQKDKSHKQFCDEEMSETTDNLADYKHNKEDFTARLNTNAAKTTKLLAEVSELNSELTDIGKLQAKQDKIRKEEKDQFDSEEA